MEGPLKIMGIILFFAAILSLPCFAEDITITTYYPSPYGSYRELRAQRMAIGDTYSGSSYCWPSDDACVNQIDANADLAVEGNVGIGTVSPNYLLEVDGTLQADNYFSGDGTQGLTINVMVKGNDGNNCTMTFKNGLLTSENCP